MLLCFYGINYINDNSCRVFIIRDVLTINALVQE